MMQESDGMGSILRMIVRACESMGILLPSFLLIFILLIPLKLPKQFADRTGTPSKFIGVQLYDYPCQ